MRTGFVQLVWLTLLFTSGCLSAGNSSATPVVPELEIPDIGVTPFPDFIFHTWPYPGEVKAVEAYRRLFPPGIATQPSVCLSLITYYMVEADVHLTVEDVLSQMSLEVDGRIFSKPYTYFITEDEPHLPLDPITGEPIGTFSGGTSLVPCFAVDLGIGLHQATFSFERTKEEPLIFSWSFFLLEFPEQTISIEPPPTYLTQLYPEPGQAITIGTYKETSDFSSLPDQTTSICLQISAYEISWKLGVDGYITEEELTTWMRFTVDGKPFDGMIIKTVADFELPSEFDVCFAINLELGVHTATFAIERSPDHLLMFSWPFLITE